ncbi:MAG: trypsin-like peptidase domain-containing protein [Patescibacteria group bacterium]
MQNFPKQPSFSFTIILTVFISLIVSSSVVSFAPMLRPELLSFLKPTSQADQALRIPDGYEPVKGKLPVEEESVIKIVKQTQPAVVAVIVTATAANIKNYVDILEFDPFDPYSPFQIAPEQQAPKGKQQVGGGSGFFVSSDGLIVTNKHVVDFEGAEFSVMTYDGKELPAKVLATDPVLDIAFLKVEGSGFSHLDFADSDAVVPGQTVIAIGNALGEFTNTVTKGVISGLNRRIIAGNGPESELIEEAIQTDAAINPGNSGGPLIDLSGEVVGLNTAVSEQGRLLGFALPSNLIERDVENIIKYGRISRPFLGVRYQLISQDIIEANQLKVDHGALIMRGQNRNELAIAPGSPADQAGLVENDIILEVDGIRVDEAHSLSSLIGRRFVGDEVTLKIYHAGTEEEVKATLEEMKTE